MMCKKYSTAREPYRAKTEYLVRWQHYTDYWDSWEPEENVKDTQTFKRYRAVMDISSTLTQKSKQTSEKGASATRLSTEQRKRYLIFKTLAENTFLDRVTADVL